MLIFNNNPGISFIILKHYVIPGLMLFYQAVFKQPRVNFGINNRKSDIPDLRNQYPGFGIYIGILIKIGSNPVTKIFSFTNIDQFLIIIPKLVNPWLMRYIF